MTPISTWINKITFSLTHPTNNEQALVRTLILSTTTHVPDGYPSLPSDEDFGFVRFDHHDPADHEKIRKFCVEQVIHAKTDGLSPAAISEVIRATNEADFKILNATIDRVNSDMRRRYGVQITMSESDETPYWYCHERASLNATYLLHNPLYAFTTHKWPGIGEPDFYDKCVYASRIVAADHAQNILKTWKELGFLSRPIKTEVKELCFGLQTVQLVNESRHFTVHGGINTFAAQRSEHLMLS